MNKTAVITGGSGAIGSACCRSLSKQGYNIVLGYLNGEKRANELCDLLGRDRTVAVKADISNESQAQMLIDAAKKNFGSVDVLVNNAAISRSGLFQSVESNELERIIDVNIKGAFYVTRYAVNDMLLRHSGSIINISSMWGECGACMEVAYSMTKAAVIGFTKALAKELGPSGIRVNCVSPGLIDTPMNSCYTPEELSVLVDDTPLCRMGTPQDVAGTVNFLAGDASSFITGQIIGVNGGYVI